MDWYKYPIFKILIPLMLGIIVSSNIPSLHIHFSLILTFISALSAVTFIRKFYFKHNYAWLNFVIVMALFFSIGVYITSNYHGYDNENHYSHKVAGKDGLIIKIIEQPEIKKNSLKIIGDVIALAASKSTIQTTGKIVLYLKIKDSLNIPGYGDILFTANKIEDIPPPLNPGEFNYKEYQNRHGILQQGFLKEHEWQIYSKNQGFSFKATALQTRKVLLDQLKKNGVSGDEFSVASALLLGYMSDLSEDITSDYRESGAMHILCVSGLHVGIIYMLLTSMLGFLKSKKNGNIITMIIIMASVWSFALISGLSPSVARAAAMFTFMAVGKNIKRNISIYNTLAASAFVLLLINPFLIFEIGFLFSYAAVISISALHNPVYSLWVPKNKWVDKVWGLIVVSLNAQIGTAPLSVFLFHTFPNYFLITNLIVIPVSFLAFYLGFAAIIFSWVPYLGSILGNLTSLSIKILNSSVHFIGELPFSVTNNIYISVYQLILIIAIISSIYWVIKSRRRKGLWLITGLSSVASLIILASLYAFNNRTSQEIVLFSIRNNMAVLARNGTHSIIVVNDYLFENPSKINFKIQGYLIENHLQPVVLRSDSNYNKKGIFYDDNLLAIRGKTLLLAESNNDLQVAEIIKPNVVLVNSPYIKSTLIDQATKNSLIILNDFSKKTGVDTNINKLNIKSLRDGAYIFKP